MSHKTESGTGAALTALVADMRAEADAIEAAGPQELESTYLRGYSAGQAWAARKWADELARLVGAAEARPLQSDERAELLRSLKWIKIFAEGHHSQEPSGVHLHHLTIDI